MEELDDQSNLEWSGRLAQAMPPCQQTVWNSSGWRVCGSTVGELRKKYNYRGIGLYCEYGHMRPEKFVSHEKCMPDAEYGSAGVPAHYLSAGAAKRRSNEYQFKDAVRLRAHNERKCLWCGVPPAPQLLSPRYDWLRIYDKPLFEQVALALGAQVVQRTDVAEIWFAALPSGLQGNVQLRFDESALEADHVFPVELLREAKGRLYEKDFKVAAKELAAPSCRPCNRGRKELLLTQEQQLEEKVIAYFFKTRAAAEKSPKFAVYRQVLAQCINAAQRLKRKASSDSN